MLLPLLNKGAATLRERLNEAEQPDRIDQPTRPVFIEHIIFRMKSILSDLPLFP